MRIKLRGILTFFLALLLLLCEIRVPAMAANSAHKDMDMMLAVLSEIGVIAQNKEQALDLSASVTRAKFSEYVAKAISAAPRTDVQYYNDVPRDHAAAGYINVLADHGIVSFNDARVFEPDRPIRYSEACKMLLCAMGYGDYALSQGEQMSNWTNGAAEAGIALAVQNPDAITTGEAVKMLFMAMSEPIMVKAFGDGAMSVDENANLFVLYHNVYFAKGVVEATYGAYLERYPMPQEGEAVIGGTKYQTTVDLSDHLGVYVEYVYRWDKSEGEGTVIYARRINDANVLTIQSDLVDGFDESTGAFSYYTTKGAANPKKQTVEKKYQTVYNGAPYSDTVETAIQGFADETHRGSVTLVDSDRNGKFDVIIVKNYEVFPNATIDAVNQKIYGGFEKKTIDYENADIVRLYDTDGKEKELAGESGVVLNVACSEDGKIVEIIRSQETASVTPKSLRFDQNEVVAEDGKIYRFDPRIMEDYEKNWSSQGAVSAFMDAFGYVVKLDITKDDGFKVGYLVLGESYKEGLRTKGARLKIYTRSSKMEVYDFADRIKIDGIGYNMKNDVDAAITALPGVIPFVENGERIYRVSPQVIRYKLSEEGKLTALDTAVLTDMEDKDNSLTVRHQGASLLNANRLGLDTYWSSAATATFTIPTLNELGEVYKNGTWQSAEAKDFSPSLSLSFDYSYVCDTYNYSRTDHYVDVLVVQQSSTTLTENVFLYTGTASVYDESEGCALITVECIRSGSETSYKLSAGIESQLEQQGFSYGDLFYITLDPNGYVTAIKKIFDAGTMTFQNNGANPYWYYGTYSPYSNWSLRTGENNRNNLSKMYVLDKIGSAVFGSYEKDELEEGIYEEVMNLGSVPVTIVYPALKIAEKGNIHSVLSYRDAGDDASLILLEQKTQNAISVIIYK